VPAPSGGERRVRTRSSCPGQTSGLCREAAGRTAAPLPGGGLRTRSHPHGPRHAEQSGYRRFHRQLQAGSVLECFFSYFVRWLVGGFLKKTSDRRSC